MSVGETMTMQADDQTGQSLTPGTGQVSTLLLWTQWLAVHNTDGHQVLCRLHYTDFWN